MSGAVGAISRHRSVASMMSSAFCTWLADADCDGDSEASVSLEMYLAMSSTGCPACPRKRCEPSVKNVGFVAGCSGCVCWIFLGLRAAVGASALSELEGGAA